jgi:hypothetical protein
MVRTWNGLDARLRIGLVVLAVALVAVGAPVAWYLGSPLLVSQTVSEAFPVTGQAAVGQSAAAQPAALSSGQFNEIDALHKGEGRATVFKLPDGQRVLRLENFKVTNGPDLFVYVSGHADPRDGKQLRGPVAVELGRLKGNIGDQNYELPATLDLTAVKSVVIYCKQFSVIFSVASLM